VKRDRARGGIVLSDEEIPNLKKLARGRQRATPGDIMPSVRRPTRGRGGAPRVQLDIDQIVDSAMAIADRLGPAAMTMRAIASELGVGVMSLYWYVPTKRDLEAAVLERLMSESSPPDRSSGDWRQDLSSIALSARANLLKHSWMIDFFSSAPYMVADVFGHGFLRHIENSMQMVESLPFGFPEKMAIIGAIDDFTRGFTFGEIIEQRRMEQMGLSEADIQQALEPRLRELLAETDYPLMRNFMDHDHELPDKDTQFENGLAIILDGVAARILALNAALGTQART